MHNSPLVDAMEQNSLRHTCQVIVRGPAAHSVHRPTYLRMATASYLPAVFSAMCTRGGRLPASAHGQCPAPHLPCILVNTNKSAPVWQVSQPAHSYADQSPASANALRRPEDTAAPSDARAGSACRPARLRAGRLVQRWMRAWMWSWCGTTTRLPQCRWSLSSGWRACHASWPRCTSSRGRTRCSARSSASCPCRRLPWCAHAVHPGSSSFSVCIVSLNLMQSVVTCWLCRLCRLCRLCPSTHGHTVNTTATHCTSVCKCWPFLCPGRVILACRPVQLHQVMVWLREPLC